MKNFEIVKNLTLGEIVNINVKAADLFYLYKLQYLFNPNQKLIDAVQESKIPLNKIHAELSEVLQSADDYYCLEKKDLLELINYIVNQHHSFVRSALQQLDKFKNFWETQANGSFLVLIVDQLTRNTKIHMDKEEKMIFPLIKYLIGTEKFNERPKSRNYGTVRDHLKQLTAEHEASIELIRKIKSTLNKGVNDFSDRNMITEFESSIEQFESDLYTHIHIENNVLFPKTIELENKLTKR
jgi:regulator of cell morphogenesis and NO signaling